MTLTSVSNSNQNIVLNKLFTIDSKKLAAKNRALEALLKTAAVVSIVASLAIMGVVLYFAIMASAVSMPLALVFAAIATVPASWGGIKLWQLSARYHNEATIELGVEERKKAMLSLPFDDIEKTVRAYLKQIQVSDPDLRFDSILSSMPKTSAAQPTRKDAILACVPVISRLFYWVEVIHSSLARADALRAMKTSSDDLRLKQMERAHAILETTTLPALFNAAIALEVLLNPLQTKTCQFGDVGTLAVKPYSIRKIIPGDAGNYFEFKEKGYKPLSFKSVFDILESLRSDAGNIPEATSDEEANQQLFLLSIDKANQCKDLLFHPAKISA